MERIDDKDILHGEALIARVQEILRRPLNLGEREWLLWRSPKGAHVTNLEIVAGWFDPISLIRASVRIVAILGRPLTEQEIERLRAWYPKGTVPTGMVEDIAEKLRKPQPHLRLIKTED
ncbi:MAG: hypothetical protein AB1560_01980 [Pseudomonadota bacterium]